MNKSPFVFDVINEMRTSPKFRSKVSKAMLAVDRIHADIAAGKGSRTELSKAQAELVKQSGFNFGSLFPHFYNRYPRQEPMSLNSRPFMYAMTCLAPGSIITLKSGRQIGKCASGDTEVVTEEGKDTLAGLFAAGLP